MGANATVCLPNTPNKAWRSLGQRGGMRVKDDGSNAAFPSSQDATPVAACHFRVQARGGAAEDTPDVSFIASAKESYRKNVFQVEEARDTGQSNMVNDTDPSKLLQANGQLVKFSDIKVGRTLSTTIKSSVFLSTWATRKVVTKMSNIHVLHKEDPDSQTVREVSEKEMLNEIRILAGLKHPCLVEFLGGNTDNPICFMLFEYMEAGDLETYMQMQKKRSGRASPHRLGRQWCASTADALSFLHGRHIIHRDLKPLNLLLNQKLELKVTDFGISRFASTDTHPAPMMTGGVGTWRYMAPEVVRHEEYTDRIDIFSFSLIMYYILTGKQPFHEFCKNDPELILKAYLSGKEPRPEIQASSQPTPALTQLMQDAWAVQASSRPSAEECLERLQSLPQDTDSGGLESYWKRSVSLF